MSVCQPGTHFNVRSVRGNHMCMYTRLRTYGLPQLNCFNFVVLFGILLHDVSVSVLFLTTYTLQFAQTHTAAHPNTYRPTYSVLRCTGRVCCKPTYGAATGPSTTSLRPWSRFVCASVNISVSSPCAHTRLCASFMCERVTVYVL